MLGERADGRARVGVGPYSRGVIAVVTLLVLVTPVASLMLTATGGEKRSARAPGDEEVP